MNYLIVEVDDLVREVETRRLEQGSVEKQRLNRKHTFLNSLLDSLNKQPNTFASQLRSEYYDIRSLSYYHELKLLLISLIGMSLLHMYGNDKLICAGLLFFTTVVISLIFSCASKYDRKRDMYKLIAYLILSEEGCDNANLVAELKAKLENIAHLV